MDESIEISNIKNEKWKENNDEKHGYSLLIGDHMFDRFRVNKSKTGTINSINYLCQSRLHGCNASITIKPDGTVSRSQLDHKDVEHNLMNKSKLELIAFNQTVKEKASIERTPSQTIYNEEVAKLVEKSGQEMCDLEHLIPTFANMKTVLTRKKIKLRPALPVNIASIILTGIYLAIIRPPSATLIQICINQ
jgi:hypothetical protein